MFSCDDMKNIDDIFYNFQCIPGVKSGIRRDFLFEDYVIKNGITYLYDSNLCFCVACDMLKQNNIKTRIQADGNVNKNTTRMLAEAGVTIFTGGTSGLFLAGKSIQENLRELLAPTKEFID